MKKHDSTKKPKAYIHVDRDMTIIDQALSKEFPDGYPDVCIVMPPIWGPKLQRYCYELDDGRPIFVVEDGPDEEIIAAVKEEMQNPTSPVCDVPVLHVEVERRVASAEEFLSTLGLY